MGLLKHVLLPAFGLIHAASAAACSDLAGWSKMIGLPQDSVDTDDKSSSSSSSLIRQNYMLGVIRGFNIAMMTLCAMGVSKESAHFRGQVILTEAILFGVVTIDAFRLSSASSSVKLNYLVPAMHSLVAAAGYVINSMEPGIFTKDKNA